MVKLKLHIVWLVLLFLAGTIFSQDFERQVLEVPKVDSGAITIDGVMDEAEWGIAAEANLITNTGYNIWANKYYREDLAEPEYDELYGRMLWNKDTLYVFVHIDEFVNDSTDLFFGKWYGDQLFVSISNRLGNEMMGWYDGNSYAAPDGPYHFWILGDQITLNGGDTTYIPEQYRGCPGDSSMVLNAEDYGRFSVNLNEETGVWDVEMAIYNPNVNAQGRVGFNIGGSMGSTVANDQNGDAYGYYTWQPNVPNDPWAAPAEADPGFYNLASSSHWAILVFTPGPDDIVREEFDVPMVDSGAVTIDGMMDEEVWNNATDVNLISNTGYNIWANKYYREDLAEPEFDELYGKLLWTKDTLFVFMVVDEFVNDSTDLFGDEKWIGDQLFVSVSNRLGVNMMGWYDGNGYAAPDGPYHYWILQENVTLNGGDTTYVPDQYRGCPDDSLMVPDVTNYGRFVATTDEATGLWKVEMAIYNPHVAAQSAIAFNVGGSMGSTQAFDQYGDAYGYYTWQPNVPNDPWAAPAEADPGFYNLANSDYWAMLNFKSGVTSVEDPNTGGLIPDRYVLDQNYPNPFNPSTTIKFSVPQASKVTLRIYNVLGQTAATLINNQFITAGEHSIQWNASSFATGVYFYELRAGNSAIAKKMLLLK